MSVHPPSFGDELDGVATREQLGAVLTALRLRAGLTVRQLASRTGMPSATVGGYVTARHLPPPSQIEQFRALLRACGVDEDELARWEAALARVRALSDGRTSRRNPLTMPPYRGLEPFQSEHAPLFFGRDAIVAKVLQRLEELRAAPINGRLRMLALVGASGSGKSSLLRAGVVPVLRRAGGNGRVVVMSPGADPRGALAAALAADAPDGPSGGAGSGAPGLVVVDQLEELFSLTDDDATRDGFLDALAELGPGTLVVAGLRADFYAAAAARPALVPVLQDWQLVVPPMSEAELRAAVVEPATATGLTVDPALVDAVVADVFGQRGAAARQSALPLMSHALLRTWLNRQRERLTLQDYLAVGGLAGAVQLSAEQLYGQLEPADTELARRLFLRLVVVDDEGVATRRRLCRAEIEDLAATGSHAEADTRAATLGLDHVVELFVGGRLLTADSDTLEITHEALLSAWPRLAEWVAADHAGLQVHQRLTRAANAWRDAGLDGHALARGGALAGIEAWAADPDHAAGMNRLERDYLAASVAQREHEQRAQRRQTTALRALVVALAVVALVAVIATVVAARSRHAAEVQRDQALSREVAFEAMRAQDTDPALAQQLGLAAYRIAPTVDARSALLDLTAGGVVHRMLGPVGPTPLAADPARGFLAVGDAGSGAVHLVDAMGAAPGRVLGTVPAQPHGGQMFALALSPDGATLAVGGEGGTVRLVDVRDPARPRVIATAPGHFGGAVESLAFSPDGTRLVAGSTNPALLLWDVTDPAHPTAPATPAGTEPTDLAQAVTFSPDGSTLVAGGLTTAHAGVLDVWDTGRLDAAPRTIPFGTSTITTIVYSPSGNELVVGGKDSPTHLLDPSTFASLHDVDTGFTSWTNTATWSHDGTTLAVGGADGKIALIDPNSGARLRTLAVDSQVSGLAFSRDDTTVTASSADGELRTYPARPHEIDGLPGGVYSVSFARDGLLGVATSSENGRGSVWRLPVAVDGVPVEQGAVPTATGFTAGDGSGVIAPDGHVMALGSASGAVEIARLDRGGRTLGTPVVVHGGTMTDEGVVISGDSRTVMAGSDDGTVYRWDISDPSHPVALPPLSTGGNLVLFVASAADGRLAAAATVDHTVHLFDVSDPAHPRNLGRLGGFAGYATSVAFSPDSHLVAAGGADDTVRIWDIADPHAPRLLDGPLHGPTHYVDAMTFSPDGRTLAASGGDGTVWTWQLAADGTGAQVTATLRAAAPGTGVFSVAYSPDGRVLTAGDSGAQVVVWRADADAQAAIVCREGGAPLTRTEWAQYVQGLGYQRTCG